MSMYRKLTTAAAVAALAFGLAACGGGGSSSPTASAPPGGSGGGSGGGGAQMSELETAQKAASDAAMAAKTASDAAATAAEDAMGSVANLATMQTGATAKGLAQEAEDAAAKAMAAYMAAKSASAAAAAAETVTAAVLAQGRAEAAQADAEMYEETAEEKGLAAETAAAMELMISGTMKSVGDSTVDATAGKSTVTVGTGASAQTTITGLLSEPTTTGATTDGRAARAAVLATGVTYISPRVNAASRGTVKIGKELDTSDDAARLLLVTHHAGTMTVRAYAEGTATTAYPWRLAPDGRYQVAGQDTADNAADDRFITLKPVGDFYLATGGATAGELEALGPTDADSPVQQGSTVGATAKAVTVYSHAGAGTDGQLGTADDTGTVYVVIKQTRTGGGDTDINTAPADIHVAIDRDGDGTDDNVEVAARIPGQAAYDHVHFGAWAGLNAARADGTNSIADLGIGFVQSIGDGMTGSDMPNNGSASYSGNWARGHPGGRLGRGRDHHPYPWSGIGDG